MNWNKGYIGRPTRSQTLDPSDLGRSFDVGTVQLTNESEGEITLENLKTMSPLNIFRLKENTIVDLINKYGDTLPIYFLNNVNLNVVPSDIRFNFFCEDSIFDKLDDKVRVQLSEDRRIYEAQETLYTLSTLRKTARRASVLDILKLEHFEIEKLPIKSLRALPSPSIAILLNKNWKHLSASKIEELMKSLQHSHWMNLDPLLVKDYEEKHSGTLSSDERLLCNITFKRIKAINQIHEWMKNYRFQTLASKKRELQIPLLKSFIKEKKFKDLKGHLSFAMKPLHYLEASKIHTLPALYRLSDFKSLTEVFLRKFSKRLCSKSFIPFVYKENVVTADLKEKADKANEYHNTSNLLCKIHESSELSLLNYSIALGSTFSMENLGWSSTDAMSLWIGRKCFVFSGADAYSMGTYAKSSASILNLSFIYSGKNHFFKGFSCWEDLLKALMHSLTDSHAVLAKSNETAAHLGIFGFEQVKKGKPKRWTILCSSVGHFKLFLYNPQKSKCYDLTRKSLLHSPTLSYSGGRLGNTNSQGLQSPDLKNLQICYNNKIEEGCLLLPMSDGIYANFDPETLGLLPNQAYDELTEKGLLPSKYRGIKLDTGVWADCLIGRELKERYQCMKIAEVIHRAREQGADVAVEIANFTLQATATDQKEKESEQKKGFLDHFSVACIQLQSKN